MNDKNISKKFVGNTVWMMTSKVYSMLVSLIVGSLSARYLGPTNYGLLNYGTAIIAFFTTICTLGLDSVIVVEMVKKPEKRGNYLGTALLLRFLASLVSFVCILVIVRIFEPENKTLQIVTLLQSLSIIFESYQVFLYWFQNNLTMKYVTIASIVGLTVTGIWRISLLATGQSVEFFALSSSISAIVCGALVLIFFFKDNNHPHLKISKTDGKYLISKSYHFIISGLAITLYSQIDRIMLGKAVSSEAVGFYSAAMTIAVMWEFIPNALINSARPILIAIRKTDWKLYIKKYQTLLLGITLLGVCVGIGILLLGRLAILILYGKEYLPSVTVLNILIWSTSFAMIGAARTIWLVAEDKNKYAKYFAIYGAVLNVILNAIFIPKYGIVAASLTTLVSQISVAFVFPLFFSEIKEFISIYFGCFKQLPELRRILVAHFHRKEKTKA